MSKKSLYNLIEMNYRAANFDLPKGISLSNKRHTSGGRYFLFELPMEKKISIDDLDLISYHVSVYEAPTGKIDLKSQYHFTAFFQNASGKEYRLHVFFDAGDGLVTRPMLSVLKGDKYEPVESDDLDEVFTNLATTACSDLVTFLRAFQKNRVVTLQRQFEVLENRLESLSPDLVKNKKEYLEVMTSQIQVLDELSKISNKSSAVIKQMKWLIASKKLIESAAFQSEALSVPEKEDTELESLEDETIQSEDTAASLKSKRSKKAKEKKAPQRVSVKPAISGEVANLKKLNIMAASLDDIKQASLLSEMYGTLKQKEWQVEFNERSATVEDLNNLRVLRGSIEKSAGNLLQRFLLQSDFNNAELLSQFYHLIPDNMMLLALQSNRSQLLDFLLKNNIADVNLKKFTIKGVVYSNMVDYFFKSSAPDSARVSCLNVLVKQGASLFAIDSQSGLPYAALLLSQPNHPLRAVLEQNKKLTLESIDFYSKMNQVLRTLKPLSSAIDELIENNRATITLLRHNPRFYQTQEEKPKLTFAQDFINQIKSDPEVIFLSSLILNKIASLMPNLPRVLQKKIAPFAEIIFQLLSKNFNQIDDLDLFPSFEDVKRETIKLQYLTLEYLDLVNAANSSLETVNSVNKYARKEPKAIKKARKRSTETLARMAEIESIISTTYSELIIDLLAARIAQKLLLDSISKKANSSDTRSDEDSALRTGLSNTFFAPRVNTVDTVSPAVNDTESPPNEVNEAPLKNEPDSSNLMDVPAESCLML